MSWGALTTVWVVAGWAINLAAAFAALFAAAWLAGHRRRIGAPAGALFGALALTGLWCLTAALMGGRSSAAALAEVFRNLALLIALYRMFAADGRHHRVPQVRFVILALGLVELLLCTLRLVEGGQWNAAATAALFEADISFRLLGTIGGLVLVHNLYAGASNLTRSSLRWPTLGIAALWLLDFNLYTVAYLLERWPTELASLHGLGGIALAALFALHGASNSAELRIRPSRQVAFRSLSLLGIVGYLVVVTAVGRALAALDGDFAQAVQFAVPLAAVAAALLILPSARMRGWLRVMISKHLFDHRYDYREEWLRVTGTIGRAEANGPSLPERTVQALAEITDSPAGLLLLPDEEGGLTLAARWRWPTAEVPAVALDAAAVMRLERAPLVLDLDAMRSDASDHGLPLWLREEPQAWALVPLLHFDRLVGAAVLARPAYQRRLDWEDFDMLRVVGRQVASYIAEQAGQAALAEAGRFDDFHRRIAFVMHDIKNLASQLSLLARNAERHAENPEFRADMLVTLRNSADKLNSLLSRLSRYGPAAIGSLASVALEDVVGGVVAQFSGRHEVTVVETQGCAVRADTESLEQVLLHLIQNAADASAPEAPIMVRIWRDAMNGVIEVVDTGGGMSPEFVRTQLFKPFVSSKPGGFGIGAYEARELTRAMGGRLEVESHEGLGTRFLVRLPLVLDITSTPRAGDEQKVA